MGDEKRKKKQFPCGKCDEECKSGTSIACGGWCEFWYHAKCIEGMTNEFVDNCDKINKIHGGSFFLCLTCRKMTGKMNRTTKELKDEIVELKNRDKIRELEFKALLERVERMEGKTDQVKDKMDGIEKEIEIGMENTKKEVASAMTAEREDRDARASNIVIYGVTESNETEAAKRMEHDEKIMKEIAEDIGVVIGDDVKVKFRAGKRRETGTEEVRPRPMIVGVDNEETRERLLANAKKLAKKDKWKRTFVAEDMTPTQREEAKKADEKARKEAEEKTEEAKKEGKTGGKYVAVGPRGKKWVKWWWDTPRSREESETRD